LRRRSTPIIEEALPRHRRLHLKCRLQLNLSLVQTQRVAGNVRILLLTELGLQLGVVLAGDGLGILNAVNARIEFRCSEAALIRAIV